MASSLLSAVGDMVLWAGCFWFQFHKEIGHVGNLISVSLKSIMLQAQRAKELQVHLSFPGMIKAKAGLNTWQLCNRVVTEETVSMV